MEQYPIVISSDKTSFSKHSSTSSPQSQDFYQKTYPQEEACQVNVAQDVEMNDDDDDDDDDDVDDDELPAWEFARRYELATPFNAVNPRAQATVLLLRAQEGEDNTIELLEIPEEVAEVLSAISREKLEINQEATQTLYWILRGYEEKTQFKLDDDSIATQSKPDSRLKKLSYPLLKTDDEIDMLRVQRLGKVSVTQQGMKRLHIDVDADEGLEWSKSMLELPNKRMEEISKERLEMPRDMLRIMQSFMVDDWSDDGIVTAFEGMEKPRKRTKPTPITPPLTPLRPISPHSRSSAIEIDADPWSEAIDPDIRQLQVIEEGIAKEDAFPTPSNDFSTTNLSGTESVKEISRIYPPLASLLHSDISTPAPDTKQSYRVETPLIGGSQQLYCSTLDADALRNELKNMDFSQLLWPGQTSDGMTDAMEIMRPSAEQADIAIQQEQLKEADSTLRIDVVHLAYPEIVAPWDFYGRVNAKDIPFQDELSAQSRLLRELYHNELQDLKKWPGASQLEINMPWRPFSGHIAKTTLDEKIDQGDFMGVIFGYMTLEDVVVSDSEAWKQDGLRIFDDLHDEEEIEHAHYNIAQDQVEDLIRKRKAGVLGYHHTAQDTRSGKSVPQLASIPEQNLLNAQAGLLQQFLALKGINAPVSTANSEQQTKTNDCGLTGRQQRLNNEVSEQIRTLPETVPLLQLPSLPVELPKRSFIISTELIQSRRALYRRLEQLVPNADFVERDFTSLSSHSSKRISAQKRAVTLYDSAIEADMILSPSTGLVLTTLQRIQQVSLPGTGAQSNPFHDRVRQLSVRYERLIILVSQTPAENRLSHLTEIRRQQQGINPAVIVAPPMTAHDVAAMARLNTLTASLPADTSAHLVVGGERELAGWTAFHMYNVQNSSEKPVAVEESYWEQTLRRAGMNCFAACIVLSMLSRGEIHDMDEDQPFGLLAYLQMRPEERADMFAGVFGGENVLKRVDQCLEREWISESRKFKKGN